MKGDLLDLLAAVNPVRETTLDLEDGLREALERGRSGSPLPKPPSRVTRARLGALAMITALAVVASALALGPPIVDFFLAKKAPSWEFVDFSRMSRLRAFLTGRPIEPGMELASPAREITDVKFGGHDHELVVAPLKGGGICRSWSGPYFGSTCGPIDRGNPLEVQLGHAGNDLPIAVDGIVTSRAGSELRVKFQDGTSTTVPVVWVSKPIDAGFFLYSLAVANRRAGHYPDTVQLLSANGKPVATRAVHVTHFQRLPSHSVPGFGRMAVPPQAIFAKRRLLFQVTTSVPTLRGIRRTHLGFWIAPRRGGGTCTWTNGAGLFGCPRPAMSYRTPLPIAPNFYEDALCCQVGRGVTRVELRFQDGDRIELRPKQSYLLASIPPAHYARGHRLTEEVAYNGAGKVLQVRTFSPTKLGQYPCAHPSVRLFGVRLCR